VIAPVGTDALELLFTGAASFGLVLLLLTSIGGGHLRVRIRAPLPRPWLSGRAAHDGDAALMPMALAGVALFGIGGLVGRAAGYGSTGQLISATLFGLFGAAFALAIFGALHRAQSPEPTALRQLIGRTARVTVSIGPTIRGTVRLVYDGSVQTLPAIAATPIARGQDVIVVAVRGMALAVREMPPP
jgi:membrane protein implicated in regulation of membrane protease activity